MQPTGFHVPLRAQPVRPTVPVDNLLRVLRFSFLGKDATNSKATGRPHGQRDRSADRSSSYPSCPNGSRGRRRGSRSPG